jgi:hypothetical protein
MANIRVSSFGDGGNSQFLVAQDLPDFLETGIPGIFNGGAGLRFCSPVKLT